jgi:hypothetical protein
VPSSRSPSTQVDDTQEAYVARRFDPFVLAASAFCARASERALRRRCLGFSMTTPVDKTASLVRPRSIPTSLVAAGSGAAATSTTKDA